MYHGILKGATAFKIFATKEKKVVLNTAWLLSEKVLLMGMNLVTSVVLARYLGVEKFGQLNYSLAYVYIFLIFSNLGTENILLREFSINQESKLKILHSAFALRFWAGILSLGACIGVAVIFSFEKKVIILIALASTQLIFQAFGVFRTYFNSQVKSQYPVIAKNISVVIFSITKLLLVYFQQPIQLIILTFSLEILLEGILIIGVYSYLNGFIKKLHISRTYLRALFKMSFPLVLSGMFYVLYAKMDQVMLGKLSSQEQVGYYAVATKLSEVWYFIPTAIVTSLFPAILKLKELDKDLYRKRLERIFTLLNYLSLALAIVISFISAPLIDLLYGSAFSASSQILTLHIWCGVIVFSGTLSGAWYVAENLQKLSFYRTALGAIVNILLNFVFIPKYGAAGAAASTLVAKVIASYLSNAFHPSTLPIFKLQSKAFLNTLTFKF